MKKIFLFFGSIYFTLVLIGLTAVLTASATFVEAKSGSNSYAREKIFSTMFFQGVLAGFFVNILAALVIRVMGKRARIGFVFAHIGLLVVIIGVALKELYGFQGYLILKEGEAQQFAFKEDSHALSYRLAESKRWESIPLQKGKIIAIGEISLHNDRYFPHGSERYHPFLANQKLYIQGRPPLPFHTPASLFMGRREWALAASTKEEMERWLQELPPPFLLFVEEEEATLAIAVDQEAAWQSYPKDKIEQLYVYEEGFKGYTFPFSFFGEEVEAPLIVEMRPEERLEKREEERPLLQITARRGEATDSHHLLYNKMGEGLATPFLDGALVVKLEPERMPLPHTIRLRRAETLYPNGEEKGRPIAFSAYLYVDEEPVTLAMNQVYESKEGLRYFLSSISPQDESDVKTVKLIVNRDPYKYWLTYPGALMIALGGLLLFFRRNTQTSSRIGFCIKKSIGSTLK